VDWAGGDSSSLKDIDGVSLAKYMEGKAPEKSFVKRSLYFHYPHYRTSMPHSAIISGKRKLMYFYERPDIPMLFDLKKDVGEVNNVATQFPEEHKAMFEKMMTFLKDVDGRFPKTNPDYDEKHYKGLKQYKDIQKWGPFLGRRALAEDEK
ncbi:MAG: DUF4976 domain-containing protein, partial [Lentisphaeraceae bacterium]|nr:DUF4976 domain-containing protein [Lentisphaeraceae bacterium]